MKSLLLIAFMTLILSSCGGGVGDGGGGGEETPEAPFAINFPDLKTHGNSLSYIIRGESNREFTSITIYRTNACNTPSQIMSATRANLIGGITVHFTTPNQSYDLYYKVSSSSGELVSCTHLVNYTHDDVAPMAPTGIPTGLLILNGMRTKELSVPVTLDPSFLSSGADGIRVYGNASRTQYFGEILRENFLNGSFTIIPNVTNSLYISNVDYAGNESALISTGVYVTNDSIAPVTPSSSAGTEIHTQADNYSYVANISGDSTRVRYRNLTTGSEDIRTGTALHTPTTFELSLNATNQISITSFDDVGNESLALLLNIHHDNIAPEAPVVHESFVHTIAIPFKGPENILRLVAEENSTITLYNSSLGVLATGTATQWVDGVSFTFPNDNGSNSVYAVARDRAGNTSSQTRIDFIADSIAPSSITLDPATLSLDGTEINYDTIIIKGTAFGDAYRVGITGGPSTYYGDIAEVSEGVEYKLRHNDLNELKITVYDIAGNESATVELNITHDNISPVISIAYPLSNLTVRGDGILNGTCESLPMTITVGLFSDTVPCVSGLWTYTLDGSFVHDQQISINLAQSDLAGNVGYATSNVTVDNVAPVLTFDPSSIPSSTNNKNHIVTGACESGLIIASSGDSLGTYSCHNGAYIAPLYVNTEGLKSITFSTADYARNASSVSFNVNFDFTAPPSVILDYETARLHNSAVNYTDITFKGVNPEATSQVLIARDSNGSVVIGTYTTAEFAAGVLVPLFINQLNGIYVFAVDEAGNKSIPAYLSIHRRQVLSRHYIFLNASMETSNPVGEGVDYRYTLTLQNASYDVNVGSKVRIATLTAISENPEIAVDSSSDCLTREIEAHDSCDLSFTVNYKRDASATQTNIVHNNVIKITYPDSTVQNVAIKQVSASVVADTLSFAGGLAQSSNGQSIFTEFLSETHSGNAFTTFNSFMDFNLITRDSADLALRRRFQANSLTRNYAICSVPTTRLCANANRNVNMPETIIADLSFGASLIADSYGDSDIGVFFVDTFNNTDIVVAGKHQNRFPASANQESGVIFYDIPNKTPVVVKIATESSPYMSFTYPHTGSMLQNGSVYVVGTSPTETVLFRINATTKVRTKIADLPLNSGYTIAGGHVLFTDLSGNLKFVNTLNGTVSDVEYEFPIGEMICNYGTYRRGEIRSIEERLTHVVAGNQSLVSTCNSAGAPVSYAHYSALRGLREVLPLSEGSGNGFKVSYINQPDVNNMSFGLQSTTLDETRHFIFNISAETYKDHTAGLDSTVHVIGNRVFMKDGVNLFEMDKEFNMVSTIENMGHSNWVLLRSLNSLFIYNKTNTSIRYFDTTYNQIFNYQTYSLTRSSMTFEGFFRGFMYFRSNNGTTYMIDRIPLYAK